MPHLRLHIARHTHRKALSAALASLAALALLTPAQPAAAADLVVRVSGIASASGEIGCTLFAGPDGFPMDATRARQQWQPARQGGVSCRFESLAAGRYAVAVSHDLNGNHRVDTNLFGMPTEAWGVSGNVRPALRAPRFGA